MRRTSPRLRHSINRRELYWIKQLDWSYLPYSVARALWIEWREDAREHIHVVVFAQLREELVLHRTELMLVISDRSERPIDVPDLPAMSFEDGAERAILHLIHMVGGAGYNVPTWGRKERSSTGCEEPANMMEHLEHMSWFDVLENFKACNPINSLTSKIVESKIENIGVFPDVDRESTRMKHPCGFVSDWTNIDAIISERDEPRRVECLGKGKFAATTDIQDSCSAICLLLSKSLNDVGPS